MDKEKFINFLDFGFSKIRFSVYDNHLDEKFLENRKVILDNNFSNHFKTINSVIKKAEKKISSHIQDIVLTLDPNDLFTIDISLQKKQEQKLKLDKIYQVLLLELDQLIKLHYNNHKIIHIILDRCIIDNRTYLELPKDKIKINNIKIDLKIICFNKKNLEYLLNFFKKNNLNVKNIFCTSFVKSFHYSNKLIKKNSSFLEIGWERATLINFKDKKFNSIKSIPIGSFHITKDISKIFNISIEDAENIKKSFNKSETEFSYENNSVDENFLLKELLSKNISIDKLKKVILYRIQEIIDLVSRNNNNLNNKNDFNNTELFLIGEGSELFKNNTFHLNNEFGFSSINYYQETDKLLFGSVLAYYLNNYQLPKKNVKKQGIFEKFFKFFDK